MRKLFSTRRRKVAAVLTILGLIAVSVAVAAWIVDVTAPSRGHTGTILVPLTAVPSSDPTDLLFPGGTSAANVKLTNNNAFPLTITGTNGGGNVIIDGNPPGCGFSNITVNSLTGLAIEVPVGTTDNLSIPGVFTMLASAPTPCMGLGFAAPLVLHLAYVTP